MQDGVLLYRTPPPTAFLRYLEAKVRHAGHTIDLESSHLLGCRPRLSVAAIIAMRAASIDLQDVPMKHPLVDTSIVPATRTLNPRILILCSDRLQLWARSGEAT